MFLEAIKAARPAGAVAEQVAYTAIHEIGHLFNLWHLDSPPGALNFMATSHQTLTYPPPLAFQPEHQQWLAQCSTQRFVTPGGSAFEDFGDLRAGQKTTPFDLPASRGPLELQLAISQEAFHPFEPVELDVTLRLARGPASRRIPDEIDPGYDRFDLWITEPDGERRLYRPVHRYCKNHGPSLTITREKPFRRDISIFGGAGGFTFSKAGVHRVDAVLQLPRLRPLRSNSLEFEVKAAAPHRAEYRVIAPVLASPPVASLLFYRSAMQGDRAVRPLEEICRRYPKSVAGAGGHYALGRMFLQHARAAKRRDWQENYRRQAGKYLHAAARSGTLTGRRAERTEELLENDLEETR